MILIELVEAVATELAVDRIHRQWGCVGCLLWLVIPLAILIAAWLLSEVDWRSFTPRG